MADGDFISTDHQFLIEYYWEDLVKRINISSSTLIDELLTLGVVTQKEGEDLKLEEKSCKRRGISDGPVVQKLLKLMLTKTNRHFKGLCEGLENEEQEYIVNQCLSKEAATRAIKDLQEALANYYRELYKDSMFTYDTEEHRVDLSEIYVPIRWVTRDKSAEGTEEKTLKTYHDILNKESIAEPARVMVKGEPASGKTTFMKKICQEWSMLHTRNEEPVSSQIRDTLGQYDLLIPIILRLVKRGATLENTIKDQIEINKKQMFTLRYMMNKTERIVIVLDGLDEYNTNTSQDITDIIKGNTFKHVIITSRAEAANKTLEWKQITYKEAELKGFTDKHIKLYVDKFFKTSKELACSLVSHIFDKNSNLLELARNPGSLCMVCTLHKDHIPIYAMNREQLYQEYVAFLLSRWEQRQNPEGEKTPRSEILKKYHTVIQKCGKLANINRKPYDVDGEYKHKSDNEDSMELSFTMDQIKSVVGEDALNLGFLYKSHPSSRLITSRFSFIHKTLYEFFLAYFIKHNNLDSFKQRIYKNRELLKQELSLTRFLLHLYMSPKEAYKFTSNIVGSKSDQKLFKGLRNLFQSTRTNSNANPDKDIFIALLDLYKGYQHDDYQTTLTFTDDRYCYIYQYPCYVIQAYRSDQDSLSSYNKDMIRRMSTDNKHKAVTVPLLQTASFQVIACGGPGNISDFYVYCRADYEVTVTGDSSKLDFLYLWDIEKMGDIHLNPVNDRMGVSIFNTNLHGCVGLTKPWIALIQSLKMPWCKLEADDISVIADSFQACTSPTGAESASPCRLQKLVLIGDSLTGAGADIARIIKLTPLCTEIDLTGCDLNDEDFYAIVKAVIQAGPATQLEKLQLEINDFTNIETVRLLLDNLPPSLRLLELQDNKFKEEDTQEIERLCKDKHPNLELTI